METLNFKFKSVKTTYSNFGITAGVVNSGNLEILLEAGNISDEVYFSINTNVCGYSEIWKAVLEDFASKYEIGGCNFLLHDSGATPAVVCLRLYQLYELFSGDTVSENLANGRYLELTTRERILALVDTNSFTEWLPAYEQISSPHLADLDLPTAFDDGIIIGKAGFTGKKVYIASQNFEFMGGAVGEVNGAKLAGLCLKALNDKPDAVILLLDSGGVRLQEANAGEIAISEVIAAVMQLRIAGIPVVAVIAGKNGAFGGIGIIAKCLDAIILTETSRTGVSGAEVIETVMGTAEYDASDRALVWRTCGGRHRAIMGDGKYSEKSVIAIKENLQVLLNEYQPLSLEELITENQKLSKRITDSQGCQDGYDIWAKYGYADVNNIPGLSDQEFLEILK